MYMMRKGLICFANTAYDCLMFGYCTVCHNIVINEALTTAAGLARLLFLLQERLFAAHSAS